MRNASPLRYPGGKWRIATFFEDLLQVNGFRGRRYLEPYSGGASLALSLLLGGHVSEIHLNDLDPSIHAFWSAVLNRNEDFCNLIRTTPVTPDEWNRQKELFCKGRSSGTLELAFATFFLNRTNYSGILNAGMIGGKEQSGRWKIHSRYNKQELLKRIQLVGTHRTRILLSCLDAIDFLTDLKPSRDSIVYLDPPYYRSGAKLYYNAYRPSDHATVYNVLRSLEAPWVVSYDDVAEIRELYRGVRHRSFELLHTARSPRVGKEVLFFSSELRIPAPRQIGYRRATASSTEVG